MPLRRPRTRVHIDGFNFYCAAFRRARFQDQKWLDLVALCRAALPRKSAGATGLPFPLVVRSTRMVKR